MSRGLGWMQREILATLDDAKAAPVKHSLGRGIGSLGRPGRVNVQGETVDLPDGVYDLRASVWVLAERHGKTHPDSLGGAGACSDSIAQASGSSHPFASALLVPLARSFGVGSCTAAFLAPGSGGRALPVAKPASSVAPTQPPPSRPHDHDQGLGIVRVRGVSERVA